ncbi:hypothetical protein HMPREF9475_00375 [[Clostridium] symbiosum WAL-14673]|nr:hypothetical protein HMPREF9475_00375 [[Clostridium] symbiosum WAL-14673]
MYKWGIYMDLKQLQYFLTIVEEGSITAAAARLHVTQPPLSQQLKSWRKNLMLFYSSVIPVIYS